MHYPLTLGSTAELPALLQAPESAGKGVQKPPKGSLSNGKGARKKELPGKTSDKKGVKTPLKADFPAGNQHI